MKNCQTRQQKDTGNENLFAIMQTQRVRGLEEAGARQRGDVASPRAAGKGSCETTTSRLTVLCSSPLLLWVRSSKGAQSKIRQINVGKATTCGSNTLTIGPLVKYAGVFALFQHPYASFSQHSTAVFCISCVGLYFKLVLLSLQSNFALDQRSPKESQ